MTVLWQARRLIDSKPWTAHLYVTDQCNLDCHYCNEYDNSVPHPQQSELRQWMRKIRRLGVLRLGLQGGEPLMHPDIVELVAYGKQLGFDRVSMSTNAFLLTRELAAALAEAGLDSLQFSVDRMTPTESTKKSLKTVVHKLGFFDGTDVSVNVSGVLFGDTIEQSSQVIDECLSRDIPVHARVIHDDLINKRKLRLHPATAPMQKAVERQVALKRSGARIHTSWNLLDYQLAMLEGAELDWTCVAGYKYFFVSAQGQFWLCSQVRTQRHIMDIQPDDLLAYDRKKDCQKGCGVYCTVDMSLAVSHPGRYLTREATRRARSGLVGLGLRRKPSPLPVPGE